MNDKNLVNVILGKLFDESCISGENFPERISVCGGSDFVRKSVIDELAKKYNDSRVEEGSVGYNINLNYFVSVCQKEC